MNATWQVSHWTFPLLRLRWRVEGEKCNKGKANKGGNKIHISHHSFIQIKASCGAQNWPKLAFIYSNEPCVYTLPIKMYTPTNWVNWWRSKWNFHFKVKVEYWVNLVIQETFTDNSTVRQSERQRCTLFYCRWSWILLLQELITPFSKTGSTVVRLLGIGRTNILEPRGKEFRVFLKNQKLP